VTEEITGQDLVEWQLRVASGEKLPKRQEELSINGWAMEARLYAENPETGFLPSTGRLERLSLEHFAVRVDTGVESGADVSPYYDPMIAKLIARADIRDEARANLASACDLVATWPIHNNAGFISRLLRREEFASGEVETGFIARNLDELAVKPQPSAEAARVAAQLLFQTHGWGTPSALDPEDFPPEPGAIWQDLVGFRLNRPPERLVRVSTGGEVIETEFLGPPYSGERQVARGTEDGVLVVEEGWPFHFTLPRGGGAGGGGEGDGALISPMPGKIIAVEVRQGDVVTKGQKLLTLEAMKMEHSLAAPFDGVVAELNAAEGGQVSEGTLLARIDKD
jgi:3-methylcrotonyl-CoA carboxylase alpha subunit